MTKLNILDFIVCPVCRSANLKKTSREVVCLDCKGVFPIKDGILIFLGKKKCKEALQIWNEVGEYKDYIFYTTPKISEQLRKHTNEMSTSLDCCSGAGIFQNDFRGAVISFDIVPYFIKEGHKKYGSDNRIFIVADANDFPFKENAFDLVFCSQVIEHFEEKESDKLLVRMIKSSKRYVMLDTPNDGNLFIRTLRKIIYRHSVVHEDASLDHHRLLGRKNFEKFGFVTHSFIGFVSRRRFNFPLFWDLYDAIAWHIPGFGGNLMAILDKQKK